MQQPSFSQPQLRNLLAAHPGARPVIWGSLPATSAAELLDFVGQGRRTGLLLLRSAQGVERALEFCDGEAVLAVSADQRECGDARAVLLGVLREESGLFAFLSHRSIENVGAAAGANPGADAGPAAGERLPAQELLLDCLRLFDEATRLAG